MAGITLTGSDSGMTAVPNDFIDRFLPEASGEYVKIYLLLWRCYSAGKSVSVTQLADILEDTEKDVYRALRYWSSKGLIRVCVNEDNEVTGVCFLDLPSASAQDQGSEQRGQETEDAALTGQIRQISQARDRKTQPVKKEHALSENARKALAVDEEFGQLEYIVGKYIGEPLGHTAGDTLGYLYSELNMSADLLEYLVEMCVDSGHKSMHYIEKIALNWHDQGIVTVEDAKNQASICRKQHYQILRAFGISGRGPAPEEKSMMDRWLLEYGFDINIILEACRRTIRNVHEASFEYAEGILADWKKHDVRTMTDIDALDSKFAREKEKKQTDRGESDGSASNRFHNFDQVGYDMDEIVRELNANG